MNSPARREADRRRRDGSAPELGPHEGDGLLLHVAGLVLDEALDDRPGAEDLDPGVEGERLDRAAALAGQGDAPSIWVLSAMVPGVMVNVVVVVAGSKVLTSVVTTSSPKILRTGPGMLGRCP